MFSMPNRHWLTKISDIAAVRPRIRAAGRFTGKSPSVFKARNRLGQPGRDRELSKNG
jgi:hypothetical protein